MKKENTKKNEKTFTNSLKGSRLWGILLFLILVVADHFTKAIADMYLVGKTVPIIPGMLELGPMSYNRGFAFSSLAGGETWLKFALVMLTVIFMAVLALVYFKMDKNRTLFRLALIFIVAGGVANFIDRINYSVWDASSANGGFRDGVRDMLYVKILFDFGFCNLADFFIVGGCIMLVLALVFFDVQALWPKGKYKTLAMEETQRDNARRTERPNKKNGKKIEEADEK